MEKEALIKQVNNLLERTKNNIEKYQEERKILFNYSESIEDSNFHTVQNYVNLFDEYLNLQDHFSNIDELKNIIKEMENQQNRKSEKNDRLKIFKTLDKHGNEYTFLSRKSMNKFMQENKEKFDFDTQIELIDNTNIDLENILNLLEKIL